jgi:hypothetical protein
MRGRRIALLGAGLIAAVAVGHSAVSGADSPTRGPVPHVDQAGPTDRKSLPERISVVNSSGTIVGYVPRDLLYPDGAVNSMPPSVLDVTSANGDSVGTIGPSGFVPNGVTTPASSTATTLNSAP